MIRLNNKITSAVIFTVLLTGVCFAQTAKRNSPFMPNPTKKKIEPSNLQNENLSTPVNPDKSKAISEAVVPGVPAVKSGSGIGVAVDVPETAGGIKPSEEFESRSAAAKTMEVAKRASVAALSPMEIYKVGVNDVLLISLQNALAKETNYFTVLKDGTIDYPLAGEIVQVQGLTVEEIEDLLRDKIKLYENPQVSVKVREHSSHVYTVLGAVENPGEKYLDREALPLFRIRAQVGVKPEASAITIKRSNGQTETLDMKDSKTDDVLIFSNDIVEFKNEFAAAPVKNTKFFYIGGDVVNIGQRDFYTGMTLSQAVMASGGLKKSTTRKAAILRKDAEGKLVTTSYDLKAIKEGKIADPALAEGDMIEIGN